MDIADRSIKNPLLKPTDLIAHHPSLKIECLLNPGVFTYENKVFLLIRVAEGIEQQKGETSLPTYKDDGTIQLISFANDDPKFNDTDKRIFIYDGDHYLSTLSHFRLLSSEDGTTFSEDINYPPILPKGSLEAFGIEDCRVSEIEGKYYLTYTQVSTNGVGVGLISTTDWKEFKRHGMILPPHNKDCALFTEKINGKFYALHRPSSPEIGGNYIWLAESPDLIHWGNHKCIVKTRTGMWDSVRVGAGASPIKTADGWLEIYHGADESNRYCLGAFLMDINNPSLVIARSDEPIMMPVAEYEKTGFFGNVVFTNGHIVQGDLLTIYYGASDEVICRADFSINQILKTLV